MLDINTLSFLLLYSTTSFHLILMSCCLMFHITLYHMFMSCHPHVIIACFGNQCASPNENPSLEFPLRECPSLPPALPPKLQIQTEKELLQSEMPKEEVNQAACSDVRRSSAPVLCNLPRPQTEPSKETVNHLTVTTQIRSHLHLYSQNLN